MSTNIVEKSRRKRVFGRSCKATLVVSALDGPRNKTAEHGAPTVCPVEDSEKKNTKAGVGLRIVIG